MYEFFLVLCPIVMTILLMIDIAFDLTAPQKFYQSFAWFMTTVLSTNLSETFSTLHIFMTIISVVWFVLLLFAYFVVRNMRNCDAAYERFINAR